jgi:hypothetical protein
LADARAVLHSFTPAERVAALALPGLPASVAGRGAAGRGAAGRGAAGRDAAGRAGADARRALPPPPPPQAGV